MSNVTQAVQNFKQALLEAYFKSGTTGSTNTYVGLFSALAGTPANSLTITGAASNGGPNLIRLTFTSSTYVPVTNDVIVVSGVTGTTEANGVWSITSINDTTLDLVGSSFVHTFSAGGKLSLAKTLVLADLTELTSSGYARQAIATAYWTSAANSNDWQLQSPTPNATGAPVFTNSSGSPWTTAIGAFHVTLNSSGTLLSVLQLAAQRTLQGGGDSDSIQLTYVETG
jgi:hypothetical protein